MKNMKESMSIRRSGSLRGYAFIAGIGNFVLFRSLNRELSLLAAWFRLVYTVFPGVALIFFFQALQLPGRAEFPAAFSNEQLNAQPSG